MIKQHKNNWLPWLLALNVAVIAIFGGEYWHSVIKQRQEQQRQAVAAANVIVRRGGMNIADATKLMELSNNLEHGAKLSDADLDWCLNELKGQEPSYESALSRREAVDLILNQSLSVMDPLQKEKLFQALVAEFALDNPKEEVGVDVGGPAHMLGKLGDKRAIPILETHLDDPRPRVHHTVQKAIDRLEGKAV